MTHAGMHESVEHPSPHANRISGWALFAALMAAPLLWFVQLNLLYGVSSVACFPDGQPLLQPPADDGWLIGALFSVNVAALALCAVAAALSWLIWRRTAQEAPGAQRELMESGEGRTRFLAIWGVWGGLWFLIAIAFDLMAVFLVPVCGA